MNLNPQLDVGAIASGRTRALAALVVGVAAVLLLLLSLLAGVGLLYVLRGLRWFAVGPRIEDSLPLLQLAGFDGQPLGRVAAAWLPAGMIFGLALVRVKSLPVIIVAGGLGVPVLLLASDAAFALAHNLRMSHVLLHRVPPFGPWLEGLLFAAGIALSRRIASLQQARSDTFLTQDDRCTSPIRLGHAQPESDAR
jgi:hypothetical protein